MIRSIKWLLGFPLRVTFDTNTIDKAARPERHARDPDHSKFLKVHKALTSEIVQGFVSDTIITLEGIPNDDRAAVFGSTTLSLIEVEEGNAVELNMKAVQPARPSIPEENARRLRAALALKIRVLSAPRIGHTKIEDPNKEIYVQQSDADLSARIDRYNEVGREIEARGCGTVPAKNIAERIAKREGVREPWYKSIAKANADEEKEFARSVREWADGDTVAAHIGYQNDVLCTGDMGKSGTSIFSERNRVWLRDQHGVRFATITELAAMIDRRKWWRRSIFVSAALLVSILGIVWYIS